MNGKIIVIEGLDGSGKATQSALLFDKLIKEGKNVQKVSFPDYESDSSALIKMYLKGDFGSSADSVNPYAASSFYAVDRYASYKSKWAEFYENGGVVICDRYTTSNAIHQCSKLAENQREDFLKWLFSYEYELLGIPAPDAVIYLRVDPEMGQKLMSKRYSGDESRKDIHEADLDYLMRSRITADYCAEYLGWKTVECIEGESMRSAEDISQEVRRLIGDIL
ncbi:MAG: deoxynucleoside kinase [Ruminococcus sp.]|nr:deoxynucleoside kinase [Ruminococcus sp.]